MILFLLAYWFRTERLCNRSLNLWVIVCVSSVERGTKFPNSRQSVASSCLVLLVPFLFFCPFHCPPFWNRRPRVEVQAHWSLLDLFFIIDTYSIHSLETITCNRDIEGRHLSSNKSTSTKSTFKDFESIVISGTLFVLSEECSFLLFTGCKPQFHAILLILNYILLDI